MESEYAWLKLDTIHLDRGDADARARRTCRSFAGRTRRRGACGLSGCLHRSYRHLAAILDGGRVRLGAESLGFVQSLSRRHAVGVEGVRARPARKRQAL